MKSNSLMCTWKLGVALAAALLAAPTDVRAGRDSIDPALALATELARDNDTTRLPNPVCADCVVLVDTQAGLVLRVSDGRSRRPLALLPLDIAPDAQVATTQAEFDVIVEGKGAVVAKSCTADNPEQCIPPAPPGGNGVVRITYPIYNPAGQIVGYVTIVFRFENGLLTKVGSVVV